MRHTLDFVFEQIRGAWRFRRTAMAVAWGVCVLGWLVVLALPDTYSARARVYVDTRTRLSQVTQGIAVESNIASQAEEVRQALLGGPLVEKVARLAIPGCATATPEASSASMPDWCPGPPAATTLHDCMRQRMSSTRTVSPSRLPSRSVTSCGDSLPARCR